MRTIKIPYYTSTMDLHVEEENLKAVIYAKADDYQRSSKRHWSIQSVQRNYRNWQ